MLCIVWSLVRRGVTRRLTSLQTMYNVLKYHKNMVNKQRNFSLAELECNCTGTRNNFNLIMFMTVINIHEIVNNIHPDQSEFFCLLTKVSIVLLEVSLSLVRVKT